MKYSSVVTRQIRHSNHGADAKLFKHRLKTLDRLIHGRLRSTSHFNKKEGKVNPFRASLPAATTLRSQVVLD